MERASRIQVKPYSLTTDSNGDVEKAEKLIYDIIIGQPLAFQDGKFETIEFFNLYVYSRAESSEGVTGGGSGGGSGGAGGSTMRSPPKLTGIVFKRGDELVIKIEAGAENAAKVYHVLIPYQAVD